MELEDLYYRYVTTAGVINEHLPTLRLLAAECESVAEFGVEHGQSTTAFLYAQPSCLTSVDTRELPEIEALRGIAGRTRFEFLKSSSLDVPAVSCDLLFIDSLHTYRQLRGELDRHAAGVHRWIVLHDTVTFGERGEDGGRGLLPALREFLAKSTDWRVAAEYRNNNGLTVLRRSP